MPSIKTSAIDDAIHIEYANETYVRNYKHKYLVYSTKSLDGYLPTAGFEVCRSYTGNKSKLSKEQWKKDKRTIIHKYTDLKSNLPKESNPFNYKLVTDNIRKRGFFYPAEFELPHIVCNWMDCATNMKVTFHKIVKENNKPWINFNESSLEEHYGKDFPIKLTLQREGHLYSTFLPQLMRRIMKKRDFIIGNSDKAFTDDWIFEIKDLVIDCISLIDITLNCLYIRAEYNPPPKWKFNPDKLGNRINRRLSDKFSWVYQITGTPLNIEPEKKALELFKRLRNHFNHFDPPCFVLTLEEIADILNGVMEIGMIIVKIRQAIGIISSIHLINFILQKKVIFSSEPEFYERLPLGKRALL